MGAAICRGQIRDGRGIWGAGGGIWAKPGNQSRELPSGSQGELPSDPLLSQVDTAKGKALIQNLALKAPFAAPATAAAYRAARWRGMRRTRARWKTDAGTSR